MKMLSTFFLLLFLFQTHCYALSGRTIDYQVQGSAYEGYFVSGGPKAPLILLLHDWDGLTDYEIMRAEKLGQLGYTVFAADLFGKGIRPTKITDKREHTGALYKDRARLRTLIREGLATAITQGANGKNVVCVGYCFGGAAALELARSGAQLRGFVTFHGGLATPEGQDYQDASGRFLIFHGAADSIITMEDFAALSTQLEEEELPHEMIVYGGAPHAFTVKESAGYHREADQKSWAHFIRFLQEVTSH